jgi:branched-chain amino acid transport system substrate-binding protein
MVRSIRQVFQAAGAWRAGVAALCGMIAVVQFTTPAFAAEQAVTLDVIIPTSGAGAFLGKAEVDALRLFETVVNEKEGGIRGRPLHFEIQDDQSSPQIAVQLANRVKAKRPAIILGSTLTGACNAMAPLMKSGPFNYCFSPSIHPDAGSFVFTSSVSTYDLQRSLLTYLRSRGWKKVAFIAATDASGQDAERGIAQALALPENADIKIVAQSRFNPGDVSATAQIEKIKSAEPDILIAWSTGAAVATIFRGVADAGLTMPVATTSGNMTYAQMKEYTSFLPKELYIASSLWPVGLGNTATLDPKVAAAQQDFFTVFDKAGLKPDLGATNVWDPALIVTEALRALGPDATAAQIKEHVDGLSGFAGINGIYDFKAVPQRGLDQSDALVTRWSSDRSMWIPVSKAGGEPIGP